MEMPPNQVVTDSKPLTTFIQVDTNSFKEVVQRLTGLSEVAGEAVHEVTAGKGNISIKKPAFKLHERRQYKAKLEIIKPPMNLNQGPLFLQHQRFSPSSSRNVIVLQSSPMSTPTKCFSSLSLLQREGTGETVATELNTAAEDEAIKERRFYLHPSPREKPGFNDPELLSLFPVTSPKTGEDV